jgi:hypothetical protein
MRVRPDISASADSSPRLRRVSRLSRGWPLVSFCLPRGWDARRTLGVSKSHKGRNMHERPRVGAEGGWCRASRVFPLVPNPPCLVCGWLEAWISGMFCPGAEKLMFVNRETMSWRAALSAVQNLQQFQDARARHGDTRQPTETPYRYWAYDATFLPNGGPGFAVVTVHSGTTVRVGIYARTEYLSHIVGSLSEDADLKLMFQRKPSPRQTENRLAPFRPPEYSSRHPGTAPGSSERTLRQERLESVSCEIEWPVACRRPDKQQMEAEQYAEAAEAAETAAGKPKVGFPANWHFRFLLSSAVHPIRFWLFCERARG